MLNLISTQAQIQIRLMGEGKQIYSALKNKIIENHWRIS